MDEGDGKNIYNEPWSLYIAECRDKTFYVGVARDVDKRIKEHNTTSKCRYTRYRKPITVKYKELCASYSVARKREAEVKKFSRKKKLDLIRG
ncbi:MAG: GIY-YIG nuclease family protein [Candidatus Omnitrophica bacterium]|nr:GIY-YIG nuclease family protein [Candidatus Omnitrophota bacterium]